VHVTDVEAHYRTAQAAGARMLSPIEDQEFGSLYRVEDFEGHRWMFLQEKN
jgi:PhnB protein